LAARLWRNLCELVFGWALVGVPLAYGVGQTLAKASSLFTV
jgi:hypothetical protein